MVYKRKYVKGKKSSRVSKRTYNAISKIVNQKINKVAETKNIDDNNTSSSFTSGTPYVVFRGNVNYPVQGDDFNERIGRSINLKSLLVKTKLTTTVSALIRCLCVWSPAPLSQDSGLESALAGVGVNGFLPRFEGTYKVLMDKVYSIDPDSKGNLLLSRNIKLNKRRVMFDGTTASSIEKGELYFIMITDNSTASAITLDTNTRLYYIDM